MSSWRPLVVLALLAGCGKEPGGPPPVEPPTNVILVEIVAPWHLSTNVSSDAPAAVRVVAADEKKAVALCEDPAFQKQVEQQFSLKPLAGGTKLDGAFAWQKGRGTTWFKPSSPLPIGEYVAEISPGTAFEVLAQQKRVRFRVGSLPRVMGVRFKVEGGVATALGVHFSEAMDIPSIHVTASQSGKALSLSGVTFTADGNDVSATLPSPPADQPLRITVAASARSEAGVHLDGNYSGKSSAAGVPFEIDVTPNQTWKPSL